jgi:cellulose biosynthesis protein BcsQ
MSVPVIAFFNNKGGVGKTSMVYHVSWMFAERGIRVIAADFDPQCNLSAAFVDEDRLEQVMWVKDQRSTIFGAVQPLMRALGDVRDPHVEIISENLGLILGDMAVTAFEDQLSEVWPKCLDRDERAFRVTSAFWRIAQKAAEQHGADVILVDLGPNLGAINRAALIAAEYVVIPLGPDLFSLQGLRNLGPALGRWREGWKERLTKNPVPDLELPSGEMKPIGYVMLRHSIRLDHPVKSFERWIERMPSTYRQYVLGSSQRSKVTIDNDPNCIAKLRDYRSLMPLAQEARKPMFFLKPADGALGAHTLAAGHAYKDFEAVAVEITSRAGLE